jgi:hypothetical protein
VDLVRNDSRPGASALLVMAENVRPHAIPEIHEAMRPFHGAVSETTLSPEALRILRDVVEGPRGVPTA